MLDTRAMARRSFCVASNTGLTEEQLRRTVPSIFAAEPWQNMSDRYRFVPTIAVVEALQESGLMPVWAAQSRSRIEGKSDYTKHMIRFRQAGNGMSETSADPMSKAHNFYGRTNLATGAMVKVGDEIPEIVLMNSHDGTSGYHVSAGMFRVACLNGLIVASSEMDAIKARHSGAADLPKIVTDATYEIIESFPKAQAQVERWKQIAVDRPAQIAFADAARTFRDSSMVIEPESLLSPRRSLDRNTADGRSDVWRTLNVVQENLMRGGGYGRSETNGRTRRVRAVNSVDGDSKINRALWQLTEAFEREIEKARHLAA